MKKPLLFVLVSLFATQEVPAQRISEPPPSALDQDERLEPAARDAVGRGVFQSGIGDIATSSGFAEKTVRIIYLVPSDRSENPAYKQALADAVRHAQDWYRAELGTGKTFRVHDPAVEVYQTSHEADWYSTNPNGEMVVQFWNNVLSDAFPLTGGMFDDPDNQWMYYIDAHAVCGQYSGAGTNGVVVIHANDLLGLVGKPEIPKCPNETASYPPCRFVGGLGHELGHGLGLPHPPECEDNDGASICDSDALMWLGYLTYPNTHFRDADKDSLSMSPFIEMIDIAEAPRECSEIGFPFAPNTLGPSDGANGVDFPVTLRWDEDPASETYSVQVSTDMAFEASLGSHSGEMDVVFDTTGVTDTTVVVPGLAYGTTYFWRVQGENDAGSGDYSGISSFTTTTGVANEPSDALAAFRLGANYPNPFRGSTTIAYSLRKASHVEITVYDAYGRLARRLVDAFRAAGPSEVVLDAVDLADGVYFVRLEAEGFGAARRVALLR